MVGLVVLFERVDVFDAEIGPQIHNPGAGGHQFAADVHGHHAGQRHEHDVAPRRKGFRVKGFQHEIRQLAKRRQDRVQALAALDLDRRHQFRLGMGAQQAHQLPPGVPDGAY